MVYQATSSHAYSAVFKNEVLHDSAEWAERIKGTEHQSNRGHMYCPMPSEFHAEESIRAQAGIEPTTLGVLVHYSNQWATEALVIERSHLD